MIVKRIQVEEGFLDGLDLSFTSGLNVLIGPRGAGKTSIIELIRFALGASALTERVSQSAREHALSILGSGSVTVTISHNGEEFVLKRTSDSSTSSGPQNMVKPVVLSQNEIETLGLQAVGRLRLIDSIRLGIEQPDENQEAILSSYIRSQTEQRRVITNELQSIRRQLRDLKEQLKDAERLKKQHAEALNSIKKAGSQNERLKRLNSELSCLSVRRDFYNRLLESLQNQFQRLKQNSTEMFVEEWPQAAGAKDPLDKVRIAVVESHSALDNAKEKIKEAITEVEALIKHNNEQMFKFEEESRALRRELEMLQKGAGEIAHQLAVLQEKAGQQSALKELEKTKSGQLKQIQAERKKYLDELERIRMVCFDERAKVIESLNKEFSPQIRVDIERAGQNSEYASAIVAALRGSGLRFNDVAPLIADQMSPREFVEIVEDENLDELVRITGLNSQRASRIIERIKEDGVEGILTSKIDDGVTIALLDGSEYKATEHLSTGQRCTVVLPLLMKQENLPVVVDQPEDHLDNAFIVDTFIKAISQRKSRGQLIFSTHNANIPVLGEAEQVTLLGSDGERGFVLSSSPLDAPKSVEGITNLMEGGIKAFEQRASYYYKNSSAQQ